MTSERRESTGIPVSNEELVTVRTAMRELHTMVQALKSGKREKFVLMHRGQMVAVLTPLGDRQ